MKPFGESWKASRKIRRTLNFLFHSVVSGQYHICVRRWKQFCIANGTSSAAHPRKRKRKKRAWSSRRLRRSVDRDCSYVIAQCSTSAGKYNSFQSPTRSKYFWCLYVQLLLGSSSDGRGCEVKPIHSLSLLLPERKIVKPSWALQPGWV